MVSPGLLQNPEVKRWLAGVEPAWTLLEFDSLMALRKEPSAENRALRLAANLMNQDLLGSSIARNAVVLLDAAVKANGLKLTATGNLARSVVEEMRQSFEWPGHDKASAFTLYKVVNEPDFMPLFFIRTTMQKAGLLQRRKGKLLPTNSGRELIAQGQQGSLQAILFHIACWRLDLAYFGRGLLGSWPQSDMGVVLWSLSTAASDWGTPEKLSRLCTIPNQAVLENTGWDRGAIAFEARILQPLVWSGLLDRRTESDPGPVLSETYLYRKSQIFDRFLEFDVKIERQGAMAH
jgi:hypothetical protein